MKVQSLDIIIIVSYFIFIFLLAFRTRSQNQSKSSNDLENKYLAGKSLTFWESTCSIIATEVSALTFLGIPAFAFSKNFSFIHVYIGAIFGRLVIAHIILPHFYNNGLTIYQAMAVDGTKNGQRMMSLFYSINKFLAVGVRLYSGSILISEFFDIHVNIAVLLISLITFLYTFIGGLKAVVRTDMIQLGVLVSGGVIAHYLIPEIGNSTWSEYMAHAYSSGKLSLLDGSNNLSILTGIMFGFLFDISTHGVDQDFAQRLTASKSLETGKKAIFYSSFLSISVGLLFLGVGALLWSYYQFHTPVDIKADQLFAHFITTYFPVGIKGIMVAGVMAATMSTLDSSINALSACLHNDILPKRNPKKLSFYYKVDVVSITLIFLLVSFVASQYEEILILGLKIASWTGGSLLGIFFATTIWKNFIKASFDAPTVIVAYFIGVIGVYLNTYTLQNSWHLNVYFGFFFSIIGAFLISKIMELRHE